MGVLEIPFLIISWSLAILLMPLTIAVVLGFIGYLFSENGSK